MGRWRTAEGRDSFWKKEWKKTLVSIEGRRGFKVKPNHYRLWSERETMHQLQIRKSVFLSFFFLFFFCWRCLPLLQKSERRVHFSRHSCVLAVGVLSTITRNFKCFIFLEGNRGDYFVLECTILIFSVVCWPITRKQILAAILMDL